MSIQFKSIIELREMLDSKAISITELTQESFLLAKKYDELNCFVTMNEGCVGQKKADAADPNNKNSSMLFGIPLAQKDLFCTEGLENNMLFKNPI